MQQLKIRKYIEIVGVIIIIILTILYSKSQKQLHQANNLYEATNAKLEKWVDKDGVNRAKIQVLETEKTSDFIKLNSKDSIIIELQNNVKEMKKYLKKQGSVTNISTSTTIDAISETEVIPNEVESEYPIYWSKFNLKDKDDFSWVFGESFATKDSTTLNLKIKNKYSLTLGLEPQGFFGLGKPKPFADVKNYNPYSTTESLRTYQVSLPKPKKWGLGPVVAYGIGNDGLGWFLGVGGTYTIIRL